MEKITTGVMMAVKETELLGMTKEQRDEFAKQTFDHLKGLLRTHVGGAAPIGDLAFGAKPPVDDPLQGRIVIVTLQGPFDLDAMSPTAPAAVQYAVERGAAR